MYTLEPGYAYDQERAYVLKERRGKPYIRQSRPLKHGSPVWRVVSTYAPPDRPPFQEADAFRSRQHAEAWYTLIA